MNKVLALIIFIILPGILSAQLSVESSSNPFEYKENLGGTGISTVYLLNSLTTTTLSYTSDAAIVRFYRYTKSLDDRELIPSSDISTSSTSGKTTYTIKNILDSRGYYAEVNGGVIPVIWIIDYAKHLPKLNSIEVTESGDKCRSNTLLINKSDELYFYDNGARKSVIRKYKIKYKDKKWNETTKLFEDQTIETAWRDIGTDYILDAPLANTQFFLWGDQFAEYFGIKQEISSAPYTAIATQVIVEAKQVSRSSETGYTTELGGSAPVEIEFKGYGNKPTAHYFTWTIFKDSDTENAIARYTDENINYTFREFGNYKIVLEVADQSSVCAEIASVEFSVLDSKLEIPNYFSPDNQNGINEFKVLHRSLLKYKCTIFNRWGNKLFETTDPDKGWDGKYNGRYVDTGAYYYVIVAEGSEGHKYKESGAINVLRKK